MNRGGGFNPILYLPVIALMTLTMTGCEVIGDIFKAGIWVGVIIVIAILAVVAFIVKMFKK